MVSIVLFGAGASFGSGAVTPHQPPLGNGSDGLFARLEARGGIAAGLPDALKAQFRRDFEKGMADYNEYSNETPMAFQRELAGYLAQFTPGHNNTYITLVKRLGVKRVIYATLNYDLLFELAASSIGVTTFYGCEGATGTSVRLLKLHGSCNLWPAFPMGEVRGLVISRSGRADVVADVWRLSQTQTLSRVSNDDSFAPVMAMYAKGKVVKVCPDYVEAQQSQWRRAAARAARNFAVGVRVHAADNHVWGTLAKSNAELTYFGLQQDKAIFDAWKKATKKKNAYFVESTFAQSVGVIESRIGCM